MYLTNLLCEYLNNPLGIDIPHPRLSWQLHSDQPGARQTAYQIVIENANPGDVLGLEFKPWDSGKVLSSQSIHVEYGGPPLHSRQRVTWCVRVWDEQDEPTDFSAPARWEMGLLSRTDWLGYWIGSSILGGAHTGAPSPYLRKEFTIDKPIRSARLYATALGLYEFEINGLPVGAQVFTPGYTDYRKRVIYQVYDVTKVLTTGANARRLNALGAILGDGWYCGYLAWLPRQNYGDRPKLLAQLIIEFEDGTLQVISSDNTWKTIPGPILESDMLMGESYDARRDIPGWSLPSYNDKDWLPVEVFEDPGIALVAQRGFPVTHHEEIQPVVDPVERSHWPVSQWIFDLGQNMVGRVRIKMTGKTGETITLRYGETLNPDGSLYTANLRSARATDYYTLRGDPNGETYEPHFTFHGFRYVELAGFPGIPMREILSGIVLHSATPPTGSFECSNPLLNQLQHNIVWGQKGNFLEIPTDCPQRDERMGWTGDAQVFIRTAAFNMNVAAFFTKWQQDLADAQGVQGQFPMVAPVPPAAPMLDGGPAWADAGIICPWTIYLSYGDTQLLAEHYDSLKNFINYLQKSSPGLIRALPNSGIFEGFGDWLALDGSGQTEGRTPKDLIGTAFFAYSARLLAQIAQILNNSEDAIHYSQLADNVRQAFLNRFATPDGLIVGQTQTANVLALHFDLLPSSLRPIALQALVRDIQQHSNHLTTGFVGSPYLMHVLTRFGQLDLAYRLLLQEDYPSWLYPVTQGATTIWERWDGWTHEKGFQDPGMNSFNHYAYGSIGDWLYSVVAGIEIDAQQPGYKHIHFRPQPGGGLTWVKARLNSMHGEILSEWRVTTEPEQEMGLTDQETNSTVNDRCTFEYDIIVPPNTTATVYLPGDQVGQQVESGKYHFIIELNSNHKDNKVNDDR